MGQRGRRIYSHSLRGKLELELEREDFKEECHRGKLMLTSALVGPTLAFVRPLPRVNPITVSESLECLRRLSTVFWKSGFACVAADLLQQRDRIRRQ